MQIVLSQCQIVQALEDYLSKAGRVGKINVVESDLPHDITLEFEGISGVFLSRQVPLDRRDECERDKW